MDTRWIFGGIEIMHNENTVLSYKQIKKMIEELSDKIRAKKQYLPIIGKIDDMGFPSILIEGNTYKYIYGERGHVRNSKITTDFDEILYLSFKDITWQLSLEYEVKNRDHSHDPRRLQFKEQERLMKTINENWGDRIHNELAEILIKHPLDDYVNQRLEYYKKLCLEGYNSNDAWELSVKKFKIP